tara:strand:+ start:455 stop:736 length:282 start_codon:yes stop_codon:yes gene_type:complete
MKLATSLLEGTAKTIKSTKSIQTNYGDHTGYLGINAIANNSEGFTVATSEDYYEDENYTSYDGFKVKNDTSFSNSFVFAQIEILISMGVLSIN